MQPQTKIVQIRIPALIVNPYWLNTLGLIFIFNWPKCMLFPLKIFQYASILLVSITIYYDMQIWISIVMLDFRRTPCYDLWSTQKSEVLDADVAYVGCGESCRHDFYSFVTSVIRNQ